ncbi:unnamed protein product [Sphenostylis stenocarpa]|uniref:Kunitz inhibitor ST1-like n=1 Tax=Sphenostylis stenocarpa TaxID=92480 RepID=A0AA86V4N9_9FABA|nr:unnamed protein product [Sphenostylis stenocarpa]
MKIMSLLPFFLLCAFTSYFSSATAEFVLDTAGNPLRNGGVYFLRPVIITANGGGAEFAATGNETCPLTVVQSPSPFSNGLPVKISSLFKIMYISEGLILYIGFTVVPPCAPTPSFWTVVKGEEGEGLSVKLTGYNDPLRGWFKIKRVSVDIGGYNLLFCPQNSPCGYVSIEQDTDGNRRFVVTQSEENRLWIRFESLSSASTATAYEPLVSLKSHV